MIVKSGASSAEVAGPRAHSICGIATSSAFFKNWSISSVLRQRPGNLILCSPLYFRDLLYVFEGVRSLDPFVAAGEHIG